MQQKGLYYMGRMNFCKSRAWKYIDLLNNQDLHRIPEELAKTISRGVAANNCFFAGGKSRFSTDSLLLEINVLYKKRVNLKHMSYQASSGIDIYISDGMKNIWYGCIAPENNIQMSVKAEVPLKDGEKLVTLYFPPFAEIDRIFVGIDNQYNVWFPEDIGKERIVVYGSSITQGCAASRPALSYVNILERKTGMKVLNFGFSESAKGEKNLIEHISSLNADIFVLEYDHNASIEELHNSHYKVYQTIRNQNKQSLIILMSRFSGGISISSDEEKERIKIIENTYLQALSLGDSNVEFVKGNDLERNDKDLFFTDDRHPNDYGMLLIANRIHKVIEKRGF